MKSLNIIVLIFASLLISGCATNDSQRPQAFTLNIPPAFNYSTGTKQFKTGDYIRNDPPVDVLKADCPITEEFGSWGPKLQTDDQSTRHLWDIQVSFRSGSKVLDAYNRAKDGYEVKVDEEFNYMFARYEKKTFSWGRGFSYFTQFTQDTATYVPHNGHLTYEIWGVTTDLKHVIHATCSVTHHSLASWGPDVRDADSIENLKKDRDYILVETCSPNDFQPPLTDIDKLVDSLRLK